LICYFYSVKTATTSSLLNALGFCQIYENCENRNDPDLVQAFLKKWWVESDFKVQASSKGSVYFGSKTKL
jgi:hypothetical protein